MSRKPKIHKLPPAQRAFVEKLLRDDRLTLDDIVVAIHEEYPSADIPCRSGLGRYKKQFAEMAGRMRDIREASTAMVAGLGEDPDDRAGQLLVEAVTALATHAALQANDPDAEELSIKEVKELSHAARSVLEARKMSLAERKEVARIAREQAAQDVDAAGREAGLSAATITQIRQRVLQGGV